MRKNKLRWHMPSEVERTDHDPMPGEDPLFNFMQEKLQGRRVFVRYREHGRWTKGVSGTADFVGTTIMEFDLDDGRMLQVHFIGAS